MTWTADPRRRGDRLSWVRVASAAPACAAAFALSPADASAQHPRAREGIFIGVSGGVGDLSADTIGRTQAKNPLAGFAARLRAGYWLSSHWGVEVGYTYFGRLEQRYADGAFRGRGDSLYMSGLGRLVFAQRWAVIGKITLASNSVRDTGSSGSTEGFERLRGRSGNLVLPGVGIEYALGERLALTLEIEPLGKAGKASNLSYLAAGVRWSH